MFNNKLIRIFSTILIISLVFGNYASFSDDIDVNVDGGEGVGYEGGGAGENNLIKANLEIKGARVSLWDVETQEKIGNIWDMVDFSQKSYNEVSKFRRLSSLTKLEIMALNEQINDTMEDNIKDYTRTKDGYIDSKTFMTSYEKFKKDCDEKKSLLESETDETKKNELTNEISELERLISSAESEMEDYEYTPNYEKMESYLCSESIQFPEIYMRTISIGQGSIEGREEYINSKENERINQIKEFYNGENTFKLINQFTYEENVAEKFKEGKICILIEPLLCFYNNGYLPDSYWMMTSAEIGLLAINGYDDINKIGYGKGVSSDINKTIVNKGQLRDSAYLALPYGTYKESEGLIKIIKAFEYTGRPVSISNADGYRDMINMMGCFEITAVKATESEIKIEFHPNGGQLSTEAGDSEINKINEEFTINTNSGEKVSIPRTFLDNFSKYV